MYLNKDQISKIGLFFRDKPVKKVYLFGSYAIGEATEKSDIDLLIESEKDFDILHFQMQMDELRSSLNKKIDVVSIGALRPDRLFTKFVMEQKVMLYENKD